MKLMIVGSDLPEAMEKFYVRYLKEKVTLQLFNSHGWFSAYYYKNIIHKVLYKAGLSGIYATINKALLIEVDKWKPDIIWVFKGMEIFPRTIQHIREKGIPVVNYNADNPFLFSSKGSGNRNVSESVGLYDMHFTYDREVQQRIETQYKIPCRSLPFAFELDNDLYSECRQQQEVMKVCFLGNPDRQRVAFLQELANEVPVDVYGHHWEKFITHTNIGVHPPAYGADFWRTLCRYRVQLNLMRPHNPNSHNMRSFEIPGVGGIGLFPRTPDHVSFFQEDQELFLYNDLVDCKTKAAQLLALPYQQATQVRDAARKKSMDAGYSYRDRAMKALRDMGDLLPMDKIVIVHFQPLEKYPPVLNMIRHLASRNNGHYALHVISTEVETNKKKIEVPGVVIHRVAKWKEQMSRAGRMRLYAKFNWRSLVLLMRYRPHKILYYETLSAGAPCLYKLYINKQTQLYIHYHEYTSPQELQGGMILNKWLHALEKKTFKKAAWISHTNEQRAALFIKDLHNEAPAQVHAVPNYPPESWQQVGKYSLPADNNSKIRFVYVGALGMDTMYVKEFAAFIKSRPEVYSWDIYSDNFSAEVIAYIESCAAENIHFKGGAEYDSLPEVLQQYHIGVILYKGHIPNYIYNAPNKLFEYLACGLDVWFPQQMTGSLPYVTLHTRPEVKPVDFLNLQEVNASAFVSRTPGEGRTMYYFENSVAVLSQKLIPDARQTAENLTRI